MKTKNRNLNCSKSALALAVILGLSGCNNKEGDKTPSAPTKPPSTPVVIADDAIVDAFNNAWIENLDATDEQKQKIKDAINELSADEKDVIADWADLLDIPKFVEAIKDTVRVPSTGEPSTDLPNVIVVEPDGGDDRRPNRGKPSIGKPSKPITGKPTDPSDASLDSDTTIIVPTVAKRETEDTVSVPSFRDKRIYAFNGVLADTDELLYTNGFGAQKIIKTEKKKTFNGNYPIALTPVPGDVNQVFKKITVDEMGNIKAKRIKPNPKKPRDFVYWGRYLGENGEYRINGIGQESVQPIKDPESHAWGYPITLPGTGNLLYIGKYGSVMMKPNPLIDAKDVISPSYVTSLPAYGEGIEIPSFWDDSGDKSFLYVSPEGHAVVVRKPIESDETPLEVWANNPEKYIPVLLIRDGENYVYDATKKRFSHIPEKYIKSTPQYKNTLLPYAVTDKRDLGKITDRVGRLVVKPGEVNELVKNPDVPGTLPGHSGTIQIDKDANISMGFPRTEDLTRDKTNWLYRGAYKESGSWKRLYMNGSNQKKWVDIENDHIPRWGKPAILPVNGNLLYVSEIGRVMVKKNPDTWGKVSDNNESPIWGKPVQLPNSGDSLYVSHNGKVLVVPNKKNHDISDLNLSDLETLKNNIVDVIDEDIRIYQPEIGQVVFSSERTIDTTRKTEIKTHYRDEESEDNLVAVQPNVVNPLITNPHKPGKTYGNLVNYAFDDQFKLVLTFPDNSSSNSEKYMYTSYLNDSKIRLYKNNKGQVKEKLVKNPDIPRWGEGVKIPQTGHLLYVAEDGKVMLKKNPETWGKIIESTDIPNFGEPVKFPPLMDFIYVADNGAVLVLPRNKAADYDLTDYDSIKDNILRVIDDNDVTIYNPLFGKVKKEDPFNVVVRANAEINKIDLNAETPPVRGLLVKDFNNETLIDFSYQTWNKADIFIGKDLTELNRLIKNYANADLVARELDALFEGSNFLPVVKIPSKKEDENIVSTGNPNIEKPLVINPGEVNPLVTDPHKPGLTFGNLSRFHFNDKFELIMERLDQGAKPENNYVYTGFITETNQRTMENSDGDVKLEYIINPEVPRWGTPAKLPVTGHLLYIAEDGKVMVKSNPETWGKVIESTDYPKFKEPVFIPHTGDLLYVGDNGAVIVLPRDTAASFNLYSYESIKNNIVHVNHKGRPTGSIYVPTLGLVEETDAILLVPRSEKEIHDLNMVGEPLPTANIVIQEYPAGTIIDFSDPNWNLNEVFAGKNTSAIIEMISDGSAVKDIIVKIQEMMGGKKFTQITGKPSKGKPNTGKPDTHISGNIINDLIDDEIEDDNMFEETINPDPLDIDNPDSSNDESFIDEPKPTIAGYDHNFDDETLPLGKHYETDYRLWAEVSEAPNYHVGDHQVHRVRFHNDTDSEMSGFVEFEEDANTTVRPQGNCMKIPSHTYCDEFVNITQEESVDGETVNALLLLQDNSGTFSKHRITTPISTAGIVWDGLQQPKFSYDLGGRNHYKVGQKYLIKYPVTYYQKDNNFRGHGLEVDTPNGSVKILSSKGCAKETSASWYEFGREYDKFTGKEMKCEWHIEYTPERSGPSDLIFTNKWHNKGDDKTDIKSFVYKDRLNVLEEVDFMNNLITKENFEHKVFDGESLYKGTPYKMPEKYGLVFTEGSNNFWVKPINAKLHDDHNTQLAVSGFAAGNKIFTKFSALIQDTAYAVNDVSLHKHELDEHESFDKEFWIKVPEINMVTSARTETTGVYHVVPWGGYPTHQVMLRVTYDIEHDATQYGPNETEANLAHNAHEDSSVDEDGNK